MRAVKAITACVLSMVLCLSAAAQSRTISGVVTDKSGEPVTGAAVLVSGTTVGVITEIDGNFSLGNVPSGEASLTVTCLGYKAQTISIPATQTKVNIILEEDDYTLEETVVVGYGTQKKVNLTGAISTVSADELENRSAHSVSAMLQGSVPGLNISTSAGSPGSTPSLNIRGVTSVNDAEPIVVIDGAIGDLDRLNPNDIESISVIKDAAAAAIYGARAAYGVILVTTKSGKDKDGKATVRLSGRWGWESPTTSTEYEDRGYWSVETINRFWRPSHSGSNYIDYNENDMLELLRRVNDKTENPDRPWVVEDTYKGKNVYKYYGNTDIYHEVFSDRNPQQQYNLSINGGNDRFKYYISGGYDRQQGIIKQTPDVFQKYNLRAKMSVKVTDWLTVSNNTAFYNSKYSFQGVGNVENVFAYLNRHFLANYTQKNPDGSWVYEVPYQSYRVGNGRHIVLGNSNNRTTNAKTDLTNTTEFVIKPVKQFWITGNFTYRFIQNRNTARTTNFDYLSGALVGGPIAYYDTGAGLNELTESVGTYNYLAGNVFATYEDTWNDAHNFKAVVGMNIETQNYKKISASGQNLPNTLDDLSLIQPVKGADGSEQLIQTVGGGQSEYALMGFFARINYDYKGRYLFELSGRYDGSSRFAKGHRWGLFPSGSLGWRISEEPFFAPAKKAVNNLKIRASFGSLGNQNVGYYDYIRLVKTGDLDYLFGGDSSKPKYSYLTAPNAGNLTWERSEQWNVGLDMAFFNNRLQATVEGYIRDTKDMLTAGVALPGVYGADSPKMNAADLRTKGYEISLSWKDQVKVGKHNLGYFVKASISDFDSRITKYDNPTQILTDYYVGQRIGDIWGYEVGGIFQSDAEAQEWTSKVDQSDRAQYLEGGKWSAGNLKFIDKNGDGIIGVGKNTVEDHGDLINLGNSLAHLQYGFTVGLDFLGFDVSAFFQGTGNHYWYPTGSNFAFWGPYSLGYTSFLPKNFLDNVWSPENPDAYFPKAGSNRASNSKGELGTANSRYIQNIRYLRFKNLTVGYSLPKNLLKKAKIGSIRVYFTGENLCYWSPIKKHSKYVDPEAAITRDGDYNNGFYPWQGSYMFGIDITF
ncbi:MAG: TonB-dependent receptor [Bacteroidales bacterium]|nr:TonB-dependent receptor [Bacteroidales bacterium]